MRKLIAVLLLISAPALADEQLNFLTNALRELQVQRNNALDEAVSAKAKTNLMTDQLTQANQRIKELEAAAAPKEAPK